MNEPSPATRATRALLIEDDREVARSVREALEPAHFSVDHAASLSAGRELLSAHGYDVIILDLSLPDGNGVEFAESIGKQGSEAPILMLTARNTVEDRIEGLSHGADDYLGKPFDGKELLARLQAILRRSRRAATHLLGYADIELNLLKRTVRRRQMEEALSAREVDLLAYLIRNAEEVLSRDQILNQVWGDEAETDSNVVNVYINYLRNKLETGPQDRIIRTVRKIGYVLSDKPLRK